MASPILTVVDNVMQALAVAWPAVGHAFGRRELAKLEAKEPFIVWVPSQSGDTFGPADTAGEEAPDDPRAFLTMVTRLEAHCRGGSFELTEALRHDLASVVHQQLGGSYGLAGGGWLDDGNAFSSRSEVYILLINLRQPITDVLHGQPPGSYAVVETVAVSSEIEIPGGSVEPDVVAPLPTTINRGHMSNEQPTSEPAEGAELRDVEAWASAKNTPAIWFKAAATMLHWCLGTCVSEAAYDQAITEAQHGAPTR